MTYNKNVSAFIIFYRGISLVLLQKHKPSLPNTTCTQHVLLIWYISDIFPCLSILWANGVTVHNGVWPYEWSGQHCCFSKIMWHVNELLWYMGQSFLLKAVYISVVRATFICSWRIPCTLHSWCNDVNNDPVMITAPYCRIFIWSRLPDGAVSWPGHLWPRCMWPHRWM